MAEVAQSDGRGREPLRGCEPANVLNALAEPTVVVDRENRVVYGNMALEQFLGSSMTALLGRPLEDVLPADSPIFALVRQVRGSGHSVSAYGVTLETPRIGPADAARVAPPGTTAQVPARRTLRPVRL